VVRSPEGSFDTSGRFLGYRIMENEEKGIHVWEGFRVPKGHGGGEGVRTILLGGGGKERQNNLNPSIDTEKNGGRAKADWLRDGEPRQNESLLRSEGGKPHP